LIPIPATNITVSGDKTQFNDNKSHEDESRVSSHLREEHRLKGFENRVLGRIFLLSKDEVKGGCRLYNEEHHNCILLQILLGSNQRGRGGRAMRHA
jgi:hypothetical protein